MNVRVLNLSLRGWGVEPGAARAEVGQLTPAERMKRAAVAFGAGIAVAVIALPIPIVHFVVVPAGLLLALVLGGLRLSHGEIFQGAEGRCPFCGTEQEFALFGRFRLPRKVDCVACHRRLNLTSESPRSPTGTPSRTR